MLTLESSDKDILDYPLDQAGNKIRDVGGISFSAWFINKLNGVDAHKAAAVELLALAKNPPIGRMREVAKINIIKKLLSLGISI